MISWQYLTTADFGGAASTFGNTTSEIMASSQTGTEPGNTFTVTGGSTNVDYQNSQTSPGYTYQDGSHFQNETDTEFAAIGTKDGNTNFFSSFRSDFTSSNASFVTSSFSSTELSSFAHGSTNSGSSTAGTTSTGSTGVATDPVTNGTSSLSTSSSVFTYSSDASYSYSWLSSTATTTTILSNGSTLNVSTSATSVGSSTYLNAEALTSTTSATMAITTTFTVANSFNTIFSYVVSALPGEVLYLKANTSLSFAPILAFDSIIGGTADVSPIWITISHTGADADTGLTSETVTDVLGTSFPILVKSTSSESFTMGGGIGASPVSISRTFEYTTEDTLFLDTTQTSTQTRNVSNTSVSYVSWIFMTSTVLGFGYLGATEDNGETYVIGTFPSLSTFNTFQTVPSIISFRANSTFTSSSATTSTNSAFSSFFGRTSFTSQVTKVSLFTVISVDVNNFIPQNAGSYNLDYPNEGFALDPRSQAFNDMGFPGITNLPFSVVDFMLGVAQTSRTQEVPMQYRNVSSQWIDTASVTWGVTINGLSLTTSSQNSLITQIGTAIWTVNDAVTDALLHGYEIPVTTFTIIPPFFTSSTGFANPVIAIGDGVFAFSSTKTKLVEIGQGGAVINGVPSAFDYYSQIVSTDFVARLIPALLVIGGPYTFVDNRHQ